MRRVFLMSSTGLPSRMMKSARLPAASLPVSANFKNRAALSVGISLDQIWVVVWFAAGVVALVTGIMWGAKSEVSFALQIIALKALPVLIVGGFTSVPGAIAGGLIVGILEKLGEFYWGPLIGGGIESWLAYVIAMIVLLFRPAGLFAQRRHSAVDRV